MRIPRAIAATLVVLFAGFGVIGADVAPASASTMVPVGAPGPVVGLPSVVTGASSGLTGARMADAVSIMMYQMSREPAFVNALAAQRAGTATSSELVLIQQTQKPAVPVSKLAGTMKVVNGVLAPVGAYLMGAQMTAGAMSFVGIDAKGTVCGWGAENSLLGDITALAAGQSCDDYGPVEGYNPNGDTSAGPVTGTQACLPSGVCATFQGVVGYARGSWTETVYCFSYPASGANGISGAPIPGDGSAVSYNPLTGYGCPSGQRAALLGRTAQLVPHTGLAWWQLSGPSVGGVPQLSPQIPVETGQADPERTLCTIVETINGVTHEFCNHPFRESMPNWNPPIPPMLPDGAVPKSIRVEERGPGVTPKPLWQEETTPEFQQSQQLYPDCSGNAVCELQLLGPNGVTCFASGSSCADWFTDPDKATKYTCRYGPYNAPLSECTVYAPTFQPHNLTGPTVLGNPQTGAPMPNPNAGAVPGSDPNLSNRPAQGPGSRSCFPSGWAAFNPVNWVMQPVQCALEWAFIPNPVSMANLNSQMGGIVERSAFGSVTAGVAGVAAPFTAIGAAGGCMGPPWRFEAFGVAETFYPFNACSEPVAGAASLVNGMLAFAIITFSILAVVRYFAGVIGFMGFGQVHAPDAGGGTHAGGHYSQVGDPSSGSLGGSSQRAIDR